MVWKALMKYFKSIIPKNRVFMSSYEKGFHPWKLIYDDFVPELEKSRESLLATGNGYLGSRGAMEEALAGDVHYPGTYSAGLYNRLISKVSGKDIENEDLVNCPNWHLIRFRIDGGEWFEIKQDNIKSINRVLDLKNGSLTREVVFADNKGRETRVYSTRFASMANPHLLLMRYQLEPLNYEGEIELESVIKGDIINDGVARYRDLKQNHLSPVDQGFSGDIGWVEVKTSQSDIKIAEACRHTVQIDCSGEDELIVENISKPGKSITKCTTRLEEGCQLKIEKTVSFYTSKKDDAIFPLNEAVREVQESASFDEILMESESSWKDIWSGIDIEIEGDPKSQLLVRLHLYHLMLSASPHNVNIDAGIAARGLHGEAYRGHIFWDELYILPLYDIFLPEVAKSVLMYRYRRLDKAREYAREHGYRGAMFPWQSGSDGREETQIIHLNPVSGEWGDDYSSLQRHISIAVAYNVWYFHHVTDDNAFMESYGYEIFFDICRFWASKATRDDQSGRYSISKVMGPDEFHELHPNSPEGGVKDNAYTNIMVAWLFYRANEYWRSIPDITKNKLAENIGLSNSEINHWKKIASELNIIISGDGIISQFDGYFELKELDWDAYRKKYGNIHRLDRILKAEGKSPDDYKLAKQADTLMTYYNIDEGVIGEILEKMGYRQDKDSLRKNYDYYIKRTSHGSTLSRVVHAYLANLMGEYELGWDLYSEALASDYTDIQGGTTAEGIHAGVMGGTVLMVITSFMGINLKHRNLKIDPHLPACWKSVSTTFNFKGCQYSIKCSHYEISVEARSQIKDEIAIEISGKRIVLQTNKLNVLDY